MIFSLISQKKRNGVPVEHRWCPEIVKWNHNSYGSST
jgi:hypothetical protein